jgi:hypothetical protein
MPARRIVDLDRHEAAFVVMSVEQRELLVAVCDVGGVVDIKGDGLGRAWVALAPQVHQATVQPDQGAQVGGVLEP